MAIKVRHDTGGGALGRLAALSGLTKQQNIEADRAQQAFLTIQGREQADRQQAMALAERREAQQAEIRAEAQRASQAADAAMAKTALQFGLEGQIKEDAFNREMETIKQKAKAEAEKWEYQYSAKQRADIARLNDAKQRLINNPNIDPVTKKRMLDAIEAQIAGVSPSLMPGDPNKPAAEQTPGFSTFDEFGNFTVVDKDGVPRVELPWYDTPDGKRKIHEMDLELEEARRETGRLKARETTRAKLANELIPVLSEGGADTEKKRYREPWEIERDLERAHPTPAPDPTQGELEAEFYRRNPERVARPEGRPGQLTQTELGGMQIRRTLIDDAEKNFGLAFSPSDRKALENAAPEVSESIMYLRAVESRYGSIAEAPTKVRLEAEAAMRLLRREGNAGIQ